MTPRVLIACEWSGVVRNAFLTRGYDAIGGACDDGDDFGRGVNHAVGQALRIIEALGGRDPARRRDPQTSGKGTT